MSQHTRTLNFSTNTVALSTRETRRALARKIAKMKTPKLAGKGADITKLTKLFIPAGCRHE